MAQQTLTSWTVARAGVFALVVSIIVSGVPLAYGMRCDTSSGHCGKVTKASHCQKATTSVSCACDHDGQPADTGSTVTTEGLAAQSGSNPSVVLSPVTGGTPALARPNYSLTRGRQSVPIPILHASLLI